MSVLGSAARGSAAIARRSFLKSIGWLQLKRPQPQMPNGFGINVVDFGATPNAPGDDTAAIQGAIDAAAAAGGGVVFFPPGTYHASQLQLRKRIVLLGQGWATRIVQNGGTSGSLIVLADPFVDQTIVRDLILDGNKAHQTTNNHGLYYYNKGGSFGIGNARHLVQNVLVNNFSGSGVTLHTAAGESRVENVTSRLNDEYGFDFLTYGATDCWFVSCTAQGSGRSGFHCASWATRYIGCKSFGNGRLRTLGDSSGYLIDHPYQYFAACDAQENAEHGFHLEKTNNCILTGCAAVSNAHTGFLLNRSTAVVLQGCNVAHIALPSGLRHVCGIDVRNDSMNNMVTATVTGVSDAVMAPNAQLVGNRIVLNTQDLGALHNAPGVAIWGGAAARPAVVTSEPASKPGRVARRLPIYDGAGALLGYIPIYRSIE
jgi:parallel beta-helix repeat protein